jgi:hypothetical protein
VPDLLGPSLKLPEEPEHYKHARDYEKRREEAKAHADGVKPTHTFHPAVDVLWFNPAAMPRIRKQPEWKEILAGVKVRPQDEDLEDDLPPARRSSPKERREVQAILSRGEALDVEGAEAALRRAIDDPEGFTPPLVLVRGQMELQTDELETLKATLAIVSALAGDDKRVRECIDRACETMKLPWTQGSNSALEAISRQVRDTFDRGRGREDHAKVDEGVMRTVLSQRHWRKRVAFGSTRIVAFLRSGVRGCALAYLPEIMARDVPCVTQFDAAVIAEARPDAEDVDGHTTALRVVAVAKVLQ